MKDLLYAMHNGTSVPLAEVPPVGNDAFFEGLIDALTGGWRVSSYFGIPDARGAELYCILTSKADGVIGVARTAVADAFPSLAGSFPQLHLFEREIAEQCALTPLGHPCAPGCGGIRWGRESRSPSRWGSAPPARASEAGARRSATRTRGIAARIVVRDEGGSYEP